MKIECMITPRKDGSVTARFGDRAYVFRDDGTGCLVCDIDDEPTIQLLLNTGDFFPSEESDFAAAAKITGGEGGSGDGSDDDDGLDSDGAIHDGAAPVEANTPPSNYKKPGRKPRAETKQNQAPEHDNSFPVE